MPRYANDPRWITAKFRSNCSTTTCRKLIAKGDRIFYYPSCKSVKCTECGEAASAEFEAAKADEDFMSAQFPSYH